MAVVSVNSTKGKSGGRRTVVYRDAKGMTHDALVIGPGTNSGLKLKLSVRNDSGRIVDDVPLATTEKSTNAYFNRDVRRH